MKEVKINPEFDCDVKNRGNTIEFPKEFLKRIKIIATLENKKIRNFCMEILDKILKEYEEKYGLNRKS